MKLLIVDDEPNIGHVLAQVVEEIGHAPVVAGSVVEALEVLSAQHIDLVITDVVMPGASGLVLARRLRADYPEVPFVLMSGEVDPDVVDGLGAAAFVRKPFSLDAIIEVIDQLL